MQEFFTRNEITTDIKELINRLKNPLDDENRTKTSLLHSVLKIIVANAEQFDKLCQVNIRWIGEDLARNLSTVVSEGINPKVLDELYGTFFRFVTEFNLSLENEMSLELRRFIDYVDDEPSAFPHSVMQQIQFARQQMPIAILKQLIGSPVLQNITAPQRIADSIDEKFRSWNTSLQAKEQTASRLENALKKYTTAFNFVGLHQGFDQLSKIKAEEVNSLNRLLVIFGFLTSAPLIAELVAAAFYLDRFAEWNANILIAAIPAIPLTFLFIYFFRIVLRRAEAARSQLLQIELRKTLCEFIQDYADYAKEIKANNPDALAKFESMIFSGIVSTDEKLPTTFDGVDQLSQLVQAVRGPK